jgi:hypothetical protein
MANPRQQTKKVPEEAIVEEIVVETLEVVQEQVEQISREVEEPPARPLDEVLGQAEKAYAAYVDAQRFVTKASLRPCGPVTKL